MTEFTTKSNNRKINKPKKYFFLQGLVRESFRNRLWITIVTLLTFLMIIVGIGHSLIVETELHQEWKEILLLVLGAFIGSYNRVIDFWFNSNDRDKEMIARADHEDDTPGFTFQDSSNSGLEEGSDNSSYINVENEDLSTNEYRSDGCEEAKGFIHLEGCLKLK